jgi:thiamine-monophosphate kinase
LICVSGDLGAAYAGLLILEREKSEFIANPQMQPQLEGLDYLLERQLKPEARTDMVNVFKKLGVKPTSMMDISDGLASEIKHLCTQSQLGAQIYEEKIPIDQLTWDTARSFNMDPTMLTLNGGEDYELIFTLAQSDYDKIKDSPEIRIIGFMQEASAGIQLVTKNNVVVPIQAQGWDSFKSQSTE